MTALITYVLDGLVFGMVLFILGAGLTLVYGLMGVINLTHGAFYVLGAYLGFIATKYTGNFYPGLVVTILSAAVMAFIIERFFIRRVYGNFIAIVLITCGFTFILSDIVLWISFGRPLVIELAGFLSGPVQLGPIAYPANRLFLMICGIVFGLLLWRVYEKTRLGALIRAGKEDMEMVGVFGVNIFVIFTMTFVVGAALASISGLLAGSFMGIFPGTEWEILLLALAVVIIGGLGSLKGAFIGALFVGFTSTFSKVYLPEIAYVSVFLPMAVILIIRPSGLFGKE